MGQLPREEKQGCLSNSQEAGGTLSCLSPLVERHTHTHGLTLGATSLPTPRVRNPEGGPTRCINLLLASPLLLTAGANWPFSSSREHRGGLGWEVVT